MARQSTAVFAVIVVTLLGMPVSSLAIEETVFCQHFNVGCQSQAEKDKTRRQCERESVGAYRRLMQEANTIEYDGGIQYLAWELSGFRSAEHYVSAWQRGLYQRCIKDRIRNKKHN